MKGVQNQDQDLHSGSHQDRSKQDHSQQGRMCMLECTAVEAGREGPVFVECRTGDGQGAKVGVSIEVVADAEATFAVKECHCQEGG